MPEVDVVAGSFRSFDAAERYFRQKVNLPTRRWNDLWQGQHARAFVVAGATKDALLTDLREAVDAAISKGETLDDFRKRFDQIVAHHGWTGWTGEGSAAGRAWRTRVIYDQNLRSAYMAGRWETLQKFPYLRYKHNTVNNPREAHKALDGLIVATDDPWWQVHYPPNGWGCRCSAFGVSAAKMRAEGLKPSPVPAGPGDVPPEFRYHVGEASIGRQLSDEQMAYWRDQKGDAWEPLSSGTAADFGRPDKVPLDPLPVPIPSVPATDEAGLLDHLKQALGGEEREFTLPVRSDFTLRLAADAAQLARHVDPARARVVPLLPHVLDDPFEVWLSFERHRGTGRVALKTRYIRAFDAPGRQKGFVFVAEAIKGQLLGWTMIPVQAGYLEKQRYGWLLYERDGLYSK